MVMAMQVGRHRYTLLQDFTIVLKKAANKDNKCCQIFLLKTELRQREIAQVSSIIGLSIMNI
jgi:hypothetical protein